MTVEHWLVFAAASSIMLIVPGPTVLLILSYAVRSGPRTAGAIVAGVTLGNLTSITATAFGLGALLATAPEVFTFLRWVGGA